VLSNLDPPAATQVTNVIDPPIPESRP